MSREGDCLAFTYPLIALLSSTHPLAALAIALVLLLFGRLAVFPSTIALITLISHFLPDLIPLQVSPVVPLFSIASFKGIPRFLEVPPKIISQLARVDTSGPEKYGFAGLKEVVITSIGEENKVKARGAHGVIRFTFHTHNGLIYPSEPDLKSISLFPEGIVTEAKILFVKVPILVLYFKEVFAVGDWRLVRAKYERGCYLVRRPLSNPLCFLTPIPLQSLFIKVIGKIEKMIIYELKLEDSIV